MNLNKMLPYQAKPKRYLHIFGCSYSQNNVKQIYFNEKSARESIDTDEILFNYEQENKKLKAQSIVSEVYNIVAMILYSDNRHQQIYEKPLIELLEEVLNIILARTEENAYLKQKIEELALKASENISLTSSKQLISYQSSRIKDDQSIEQNHPSLHHSNNILQNSQKVSINKPKYEPKILFSIGKQVKTVNQISSGRTLKKDSFNSNSKSSSQQNSYTELLNATKKNRLSIDKSIYLDEKDIQNIKSSVQNISRISHIDNFQGRENVGVMSRQLTPIKQERFSSDQYSQINSSKINNADRFTFQSTNTDPQIYNKNR